MPSPRFLDQELLDAFDEELRRLGAPLADNWAPGLTDEQIDAILMPLDLDLPEEARVWWRWRNGADSTAPTGRTLFGDRRFLSLQQNRESYEVINATWEDARYRKLLEPVDQRPSIFFDCHGPHDAPVPVLWAEDLDPPELSAPSIGTLVRRWIEVLNSGNITVAEDGIWDYGPLSGRPVREIGF